MQIECESGMKPVKLNRVNIGNVSQDRNETIWNGKNGGVQKTTKNRNLKRIENTLMSLYANDSVYQWWIYVNKAK